MTQNTLRNKVLISAQRALWGMVYPSIRAIAVGFDGLDELTMIYYLDREPLEQDYESISIVTGNICADIEFESVNEKCIYTMENFNKLDYLTSWVYVRKEDME